ncbi:hypothetical protein ACWOAH_11180 [Vagococcus vulneris]|uniref:Uncharacterized protein n=1 Tax=Vagococcus vulneris TaxID=1977869 RepID=A0A429ZR28_9ENTE|nr:hypothetical protein [Vagococcus vulneris]RST96146.1 hypothetical protein CBF37_11200 [Vagococcus vulneris]RSU00097.1 hypothetical protein CBF37_02010 [Vagococcus vulneris]
MRRNLTGTVDKIKLLSSFPDMLVRFSIIDNDIVVNCIVHDRSLGNRLMFLEDGKSEVAVFGHYNSRNQLVVEKMALRNPSSFEREFAV